MKRLVVLWILVFTMMPFMAVLAADVEPPQWTFDDKDAEKELGTWGGQNQLKPLEIKDVKDSQGNTRSVLFTSSLGGDPYLYPGGDSNSCDYDPFDGSKYDTLYLGVRVNATNDWQIYYISKEDMSWAEAQHQNFTVEATGKFEDLQIPVTQGGWNKKTIVRFRIDPGTAANIEAEIDYISFTGVPGGKSPVEPNEKLSTVWGKIKFFSGQL